MALIEVDQSGKWESSTHTVIGASIDGKPYSALIDFQSKDTINKILGRFDQERTKSKKKEIIRMFTYSVFLTIKDLIRIGDDIVIDPEYEGKDDSIRDLLLHLFEKFKGLKLNRRSIQFRSLGKISVAHKVAHQAFTYKRTPDKRLIFEDYHKLLDKTVEIRGKAFLKRKKKRGLPED